MCVHHVVCMANYFFLRVNMGKNTRPPPPLTPQIVVANTAFLHLVFYVSIEITFQIIFICLNILDWI
jgi:hypothetical protein